jgi:hypothetical protein
MLKEAASESETEQESVNVQEEDAVALDRAMEERTLAWISSSTSVEFCIGTMGSEWHGRYARKRAGFIESSVTTNNASKCSFVFTLADA